MRWTILLLIIGFSLPLAAQDPIPDTTEVWRYFPLEMGNVWEYRAEIELVPPDCFPACVQNWRRTVVGDSTIGDFTYQTILLEKFKATGEALDSSMEFYRLDTLFAEIRQPYGSGEFTYGGTECGLDAPFPPEKEYLPCEGSASYVVGEGYDRTVEIGSTIVVTAVKSLDAIFSNNFRYAADIGLVSNKGSEGSSWEYQLTYAYVGGVEYGTPFPVGIEEDLPEWLNFRLAPAYPNPGSDQFFLDLTLDRPGRISIAVYDVLGRRVYSDQQEASAGKTTIPIEAFNWPRGHFLVRATTSDGQIGTARITRR